MNNKDAIRKDLKVSDYLSKRFNVESRRSFISKISKAVFALAGVHLASRVPLVGGPFFQQLNCAIAGYKCGTGNCTTSNGSVGGQWKACCEDVPNCEWKCCTYKDYCTNNAFTPNSNCSWLNGGASFPCDGTKWCGGAGSNYVCTTTSCTGNYATSSACSSSC